MFDSNFKLLNIFVSSAPQHLMQLMCCSAELMSRLVVGGMLMLVSGGSEQKRFGATHQRRILGGTSSKMAVEIVLCCCLLCSAVCSAHLLLFSPTHLVLLLWVTMSMQPLNLSTLSEHAFMLPVFWVSYSLQSGVRLDIWVRTTSIFLAVQYTCTLACANLG